MHGGPSLFRRNWANDGKKYCCSVEIGADYHHDGDDCYTHDDEGRGVKSDAAELVRRLEEYKPNQGHHDGAAPAPSVDGVVGGPNE